LKLFLYLYYTIKFALYRLFFPKSSKGKNFRIRHDPHKRRIFVFRKRQKVARFHNVDCLVFEAPAFRQSNVSALCIFVEFVCKRNGPLCGRRKKLEYFFSYKVVRYYETSGFPFPQNMLYANIHILDHIQSFFHEFFQRPNTPPFKGGGERLLTSFLEILYNMHMEAISLYILSD